MCKDRATCHKRHQYRFDGVDYSDCVQSERQAAIEAFSKILGLVEHDSPVYQIAAEMHSWLVHEEKEALDGLPLQEALRETRARVAQLEKAVLGVPLTSGEFCLGCGAVTAPQASLWLSVIAAHPEIQGKPPAETSTLLRSRGFSERQIEAFLGEGPKACTENCWADKLKKVQEDTVPTYIAPREQWVVIWDPPINKPTAARLFNDNEAAFKFYRQQSENGWPMNTRIIHVPNYLWEGVD